MQEEKAKLKSPQERLDQLEEICQQCRECKLHTNRIKTVFGEGDPKSPAMFIGEAPGERENFTGRPFVGRAGILLRNMLKAIDIDPEEIYIANIVKCRPPQNRDPEYDEMQSCWRFLKKQIEIIQPKILVLLGKISVRAFFPDIDGDVVISHVRLQCKDMKTFVYNNIPTLITYHPSALLRSKKFHERAKEDFIFIKESFKKSQIQVSNDLFIPGGSLFE